jgi:spore coat protein U-like protein
MNRLGSIAALPAAAVFLLSLLPYPAYSATCSFQSRGGLALSFGALNPSVASNVTAVAAAISLHSNEWGKCANTVMTMTADNGLNGNRRLSNGTAFIPYSLSLPANANGGNGFEIFVLSGTVLGTDYIDAPAGSYSDTVQITVTP